MRPKILLITERTTAAASWSPYACAQIINTLRHMGIDPVEVALRSDGTLGVIESDYDGCMVVLYSALSGSSTVKTFLAASHPWKPYVVGRQSLANSAPVTSGMSAVADITAPTLISLHTGDHLAMGGYDGTKHTHDGTTTITSYVTTADGKQLVWATATAIYSGWYASSSSKWTVAINAALYAQILELDNVTPLRVIVSCDDIKQSIPVAARTCIGTFAAEMRTRSGQCTIGWNNQGLNYDLGSDTNPSIPTDLVANDDVYLFCLHDHANADSTGVNVFGDALDEAAVAAVVADHEAQCATASAQLGATVHFAAPNGLAICPNNRCSMLGLRAGYQDGWRIMRPGALNVDQGAYRPSIIGGRFAVPGEDNGYVDVFPHVNLFGASNANYGGLLWMMYESTYCHLEPAQRINARLQQIWKQFVLSGTVHLWGHGINFLQVRQGVVGLKSTQAVTNGQQVVIGDSTYVFWVSGEDPTDEEDNIYAVDCQADQTASNALTLLGLEIAIRQSYGSYGPVASKDTTPYQSLMIYDYEAGDDITVDAYESDGETTLSNSYAEDMSDRGSQLAAFDEFFFPMTDMLASVMAIR